MEKNDKRAREREHNESRQKLNHKKDSKIREGERKGESLRDKTNSEIKGEKLLKEREKVKKGERKSFPRHKKDKRKRGREKASKVEGQSYCDCHWL